jgi:hypothetical protein
LENHPGWAALTADTRRTDTEWQPGTRTGRCGIAGRIKPVKPAGDVRRGSGRREALVVAFVLPLTELVVEDLGVIDDDAVEEPVELLGIDGLRALGRCLDWLSLGALNMAIVERLVPDRLGDIFRGVAPEPPSSAQGWGRRRCDDRAVLAAIVFIATSGCAWRPLPLVFGASWQAVHRRFTDWSAGPVWAKAAPRGPGPARCGRLS